MKYQNFEDELKDLFHGATVPVDVDAIIRGIHEEKPSRRPKTWLWLSLFALFAISGVYTVDAIMSSNHALENSASLTSALTGHTEGKGYTVDSDIPAASTPAGAATAEAHTESSQPPLSKQNAKAASPVTETKKSTKSVASNLQTTDVKRTTPPSKEAANATVKNSQVTELSTSANTMSSATTDSSSSSTAQTNTSTDIAAPIANLTTRLTAASAAIAQADIDLLDYKRELPTKNDVKCPTFKKSTAWHLDIIPEVGYIVPFKTLTNNTPEANNVFEKRAAAENTLEGVQAALYARVRRGASPFYFKFGLSYTRVSERMDLNTSYDSVSTEIGIISITQSQTGDTLTVITGPIETTTTITKTSRDHYYLSLLDIPVAAGYSQSIGGGWRVGAEIGAQFNISMSTSGRLLEDDIGANNYVELPAQGRFEPSLGVSLFGGFTLERAISARSSFYVSPRFRYFPSNFTPGSYPVQQAYQFAGIHAGYVYSF